MLMSDVLRQRYMLGSDVLRQFDDFNTSQALESNEVLFDHQYEWYWFLLCSITDGL